MEDCTPECEALLPSAGQCLRETCLSSPKVRHLQNPLHALVKLRILQSVHAAIEADVLFHRQIIVERETLRHVANVELHEIGLFHDVIAANPRRSGCWLQQPNQHADRR